MTADMLHRRIASLEAERDRLLVENAALRLQLDAERDDVADALDFAHGPYQVKP